MNERRYRFRNEQEAASYHLPFDDFYTWIPGGATIKYADYPPWNLPGQFLAMNNSQKEYVGFIYKPCLVEIDANGQTIVGDIL
jgi:hypothetical protein